MTQPGAPTWFNRDLLNIYLFKVINILQEGKGTFNTDPQGIAKLDENDWAILKKMSVKPDTKELPTIMIASSDITSIILTHQFDYEDVINRQKVVIVSSSLSNNKSISLKDVLHGVSRFINQWVKLYGGKVDKPIHAYIASDIKIESGNLYADIVISNVYGFGELEM